MKDFKVVGKPVRKIDAIPLATGQPLFTDDVDMPGMLHARILWSPYAHARIKDIDISEAERLPGVHAVLCYKNVPRVMHTTAGQAWPEPSPYDTAMFDRKVRYVGDRVAAVAAETPEIAERALQLIRVEYEPLPAVLDPEEAIKEGAPVIHDEPDCKYVLPIRWDPKRNIAAHVELETGDFERGLREAEVVVEGKFRTHQEQHCCLETHSCIAYVDPAGRLVIRTSTQVPFHVRRIVAQCLQIPERMVRVVKPRIGGGFGGKQSMIIEDVCAMLAWRTKRPVRLVYTRREEFMSAHVRHAMVLWGKIGAKRDGRLTAIELRVLSNAGAYGAHGMTVVNNTCAKTLPLFRCENIRWVADVAYTNTVPGGAYRGYGVTQGIFPMAILMDELAERLGMDPVDFWKLNTVREGDTHPIFEKLGEVGKGVAMRIESCSLPECIDRAAEVFEWKKKRAEYSKPQSGPVRRGVGMVCVAQGATVPLIDMASASAKMNDDGSFNLLIGATDLGTGADTVLSQIFAETLDIPVEDVIVYAADTDFTPFDKGAYASSTTYCSGMAVLKTAEAIKRQILKVASEMLGEPEENLRVRQKGVESKQSGKRVEFHEIAKHSMYVRKQFQIAATESFASPLPPQSYSAHFVEVEVDVETGEVRVPLYVVAVDCGTAINPKLAEGQAEGAVLNGISHALYEQYVWDERGRMLNPSFGSYRIATTLDAPEIKTILVPSYEPSGPYGAKSIGEVCVNGPLPAISNAIYHAVGIRLRESPFTPDRVLRALKGKSKS